MNRRISKSFKLIFSSFYPNFDKNEIENSESYFNFIMEKYPDRSEIFQLKIFLVMFSINLRKIFLKDSDIHSFFHKLQQSNLTQLRKLGTGITSLLGWKHQKQLCISRVRNRANNGYWDTHLFIDFLVMLRA